MEVILPVDKWRYMVTTGLWPKKGNFDPQGWCSNFTQELPLALRLLEGFTFFSDELVKQMFRSAFLSVSETVVADKNNLAGARQQWAKFIDSLVVVRVTGEVPTDADSGFAFSRLARDVLLLNEGRIVAPEVAVRHLAAGNKANILFVDDFVGSGNQFSDTWKRDYPLQGGGVSSFEKVYASIGSAARFIYCPVICTELGRQNIARKCGGVEIIPAHFYTSRQSAISSDSAIWREDMRTEGPDFVRSVSTRAGIPDNNGAEGCWRGFHKLGLALAFSHGFPDATLPIFYSTLNGWKPLLKKGAL
jgi:hypothetical protein